MLQRLRRTQVAALACLAAVFTALAGPPRAAAQTESSAAQALFDEAKALMAQGRYELACPKLEESQRLEPALGTLLNLADCREKQGKLASAWSLFRDAEGVARRAGPEEAATVARHRASQLEQRVPRLVLRLTAAAPPAFRLTRNDVVIGAAQLGTPIPLDPGTYRIAASAPGYASWETSVTLREAVGTVDVTVPELRRAASSPVVSGKPTSPAVAADDAAVHHVPALTWVLGGTGAALLGASGWLALSAKSQYDGANCPKHVCESADDLTTRNDARTKAAIATGLGVGGALALGGGVLLWAVHGTAEHQEHRVSLGVTGRGLRFTATF